MIFFLCIFVWAFFRGFFFLYYWTIGGNAEHHSMQKIAPLCLQTYAGDRIQHILHVADKTSYFTCAAC